MSNDEQGGPYAPAPMVHELVAKITGRYDLVARQHEADRLLAAEGAGHIVHDLPVRADGRTVSLASRPWRLDPIPVVVDAAEFSVLADRVVARMRMLEAILADLYGPRTLLTDRILEPADVWASYRYRLAAIGQLAAPRWMTTYSVDVAKDTSGNWHVVQDLTDQPPGGGYTFMGRNVLARVHRDAIAVLPRGAGLRSIDPFADQLRDALADLAKTESPRIVVMSGGVEHPSFVGQAYLASRLGLNVAEGADLVVRQRRLWLRSLAGLEPIDVLHRRLEGDRIDPMEVNAVGVGGVPGLLDAVRAGGVRLANAHGTGVLEDPVLAESWDDAGDWIADRHRRSGDVEPLRRLSAERRTQIQFELAPCLVGAEVVYRPVVVRLQLVASDRRIEVMQGASARVLNPGDDPNVPTAATAKDVWVIGGTVAPPLLARREPLPQVDLIASVPTRAAEALFWAGRALERAELVTRSLEVVLERTTGVIDTDTAEPWVIPSSAMLMEIAGLPKGMARTAAGPMATPSEVIERTLTALAQQLGSVLAEVSSVREFFSTSAGRAFARLAASRAAIQRLQQDNAVIRAAQIDRGLLDSILNDLSSVIGLWNESVVRGPAWHFGEIGRRLERVFGVIDGVRGALALSTIEPMTVREEYDAQRLIEIVLATNESLVAYRRRYRSDVEFALAMDLVVSDERNPRAAMSALRSIVTEADALGWDEGKTVAEELIALLGAESYETVAGTMATLGDLWNGADRLARGIVSEYLASPLDPASDGTPVMTDPIATNTSSGTQYRVTHRTDYSYGATMLDGYSVAYLLVRPTPSQRVLSSMLTTNPVVDEYDEWPDVFGNRMVQLGVHQPHTEFTVEAVSEVVVYSQERPRSNQPWERVAAQIAAMRGPLVLETSAFTAPSRYVTVAQHRAALLRLATQAFTPGRPILDGVEALCTLIFQTFAFDPTFTDVSTPLGDILYAQRGVCQDFAHLAVGCLRSLGLAARYVSGYIETEPPPGEVRSIGADASHAWCSVWIPDHGWLDFDPTNGVVAPGRHITVGWGRDYADVAPLRGVVIGPSSLQTLWVSVDVRRM